MPSRAYQNSFNPDGLQSNAHADAETNHHAAGVHIMNNTHWAVFFHNVSVKSLSKVEHKFLRRNPDRWLLAGLSATHRLLPRVTDKRRVINEAITVSRGPHFQRENSQQSPPMTAAFNLWRAQRDYGEEASVQKPRFPYNSTTDRHVDCGHDWGSGGWANRGGKGRSKSRVDFFWPLTTRTSFLSLFLTTLRFSPYLIHLHVLLHPDPFFSPHLFCFCFHVNETSLYPPESSKLTPLIKLCSLQITMPYYSYTVLYL